MKNRSTGFTLIEMLIAVVIVSILAAIAIPAYSKYAQRARRSDAINMLERVAALQERYYFQNNVYDDGTHILGANTSSPEGYYTISISQTDTTTYQDYKITAAATGAQTADTDCLTLTLDNKGLKTPSPDTKGCWHR